MRIKPERERCADRLRGDTRQHPIRDDGRAATGSGRELDHTKRVPAELTGNDGKMRSWSHGDPTGSCRQGDKFREVLHLLWRGPRGWRARIKRRLGQISDVNVSAELA